MDIADTEKIHAYHSHITLNNEKLGTGSIFIMKSGRKY